MPRVPRFPVVGRIVRATGEGGGGKSVSGAAAEATGVSFAGATGAAGGGGVGLGGAVGGGVDAAGGMGAGDLGLVNFAHNACKPIIAIIHIARMI